MLTTHDMSLMPLVTNVLYKLLQLDSEHDSI